MTRGQVFAVLAVLSLMAILLVSCARPEGDGFGQDRYTSPLCHEPTPQGERWFNC